jgi:hypothetical protein
MWLLGTSVKPEAYVLGREPNPGSAVVQFVYRLSHAHQYFALLSDDTVRHAATLEDPLDATTFGQHVTTS